MQTVGESPMKDKMPNGAADNEKIMHADLSKDGATLLMAADMMDPKTFTQGDTITLSINCTSEEEINTIFKKLSAGGKVTMPLQKQFWNAYFGMCVDKFGVQWMVNYDYNQNK